MWFTKIRAQASGQLQSPEACHFRTIIQRQGLPQLWRHSTQAGNECRIEGRGCLVLDPGQQEKATLAFGTAEQRCLAPGGTDQIGCPIPKRDLSATGCGRCSGSMRPGKTPFALAGPEFAPHLFGRAVAAGLFIEVGNQISSERLIHGHGAASFAFLRVSAVEQDSRL